MKSKTIYICGSLFGLFLFATPAYAAGGDGLGEPWDTLLKLVNLIIFLFILYKLGAKPISQAMGNSAKQAKDQLEEARSTQKATQKELEDYEQKLTNMKVQAETMVANALKEAQAEKAQLMAEAEAYAQKIKEQAQFTIEQEYKKAQYELKQWIATETMKLAEQSIQEKLDAKQHEKLVQDYTHQLN